MTYLSGAQQKLISAFQQHEMTFKVESDHVIVNNSKSCTEAKIQKIVEEAGFCPLMLPSKCEGYFSFTVSPYQLPALYFNKGEIGCQLIKSIFVPVQNQDIKDRWSIINLFRNIVSSALNKAVSDVVSRYAKDEHPIIEIGSGIGYTLSEELSAKTIRIQPHAKECALLSKVVPGPVYQLDIEGLYHNLINSVKKVPLFFALNIFDTMTTEVRKRNLFLISQLQMSGDHLLIMLDVNPYTSTMFVHLKALYPQYLIFPYVSPIQSFSKISAMLIPMELYQKEYNEIGYSESDFFNMIKEMLMAVEQDKILPIHRQLIESKEKHNLKVIALEDLFVEMINSDLKDVGYETNVYYHASFVIDDHPKDMPKLGLDLFYKPTADSMSVRQWSFNHKELEKGLAEKGLSLPTEFNEYFFSELRKKNQTVLGAELLVIDAEKI